MLTLLFSGFLVQNNCIFSEYVHFLLFRMVCVNWNTIIIRYYLLTSFVCLIENSLNTNWGGVWGCLKIVPQEKRPTVWEGGTVMNNFGSWHTFKLKKHWQYTWFSHLKSWLLSCSLSHSKFVSAPFDWIGTFTRNYL